MIRTSFIVFAFLFVTIASFAQPAQTIRGVVHDHVSGEPVGLASLVLRRAAFSESTVADSAGCFGFGGIPVGRYDVEVSCTGYESLVIREVIAGSAKETFLTIGLKQQVNLLDDVVVRPATDKQRPLNAAATVSARMLSVDEARRYAGGFDDPARLVAAFAGVSSNTGNNAIIVRGNSPQALQWKMEGVEIPAPNHLGDMRAFGGGSVTALSAQLLANSDFFSGAMPAEYSNALSGVFDIQMRTGNNQQYEHTFQAGVVGLDAASEGPFRKGGQSSYLLNYRYSTLALVAPLLADNAGSIRYQDLSFKLNFPTKKIGTFSVWGMGLTDRMGAEAKQDVREWVYEDDRENHRVRLHMGVAGLTHSLRINRKQHLKTTLAATLQGINYPTERLDSNLLAVPRSFLNNHYYNLVLSSFVHTKFHARHTNKTGFTLTNMNYRMLVQHAYPQDGPLQDIARETGNATLVSAYTNSTLRLGDRTTVNAGVNSVLFTLNNQYSLEPRVGIRCQVAPGQSLGLAYGLHSRLERLNHYFIRDSRGDLVNNNLDFIKAHHWVLGYGIGLSELVHFKAEMYYQYLFDVPVIGDSSFSMLNQQGDWYFSGPLQSSGAGRNYGIDLTLEKYLSRGYYYMVTASFFRSRYRGGDYVWRDTRYNRGYACNLLVGKEWALGSGKQNMLGINARFCYQGGDRYTPVDRGASVADRSPVFDAYDAFSRQYPAAFTSHLTLSYKMNGRRRVHEIALKIINLTQYQEYVGFRYNHRTNEVDINRETVVIPNLSYRIDF